MDLFSTLAVGLAIVLMALSAWWAFRSYKHARWVRFSIALFFLVILGFGWNYFPIIIFLILAPIFGWSFT